jgi:hypothetical protein
MFPPIKIIVDDPVCFVAGECEGIVLDIESSPSQDECLDLCGLVIFKCQKPVCSSSITRGGAMGHWHPQAETDKY